MSGSSELIAGYVQHVPVNGYQLRALRPLNPDATIPEQDRQALAWPETSGLSRRYQPLVDEPALLCKFTDLGLNPGSQEILAFANQYGWLGVSETSIDASDLDDSGFSAPKGVIAAEFVHHWHRALLSLKPHLDLWYAVARQDTEHLQSVIHWHPQGASVSYGWQTIGSALIASTSLHAELFSTLTPGDLVKPAKVVLARVVNQHLCEHCSPALLFTGITYQTSHLHFRCNNLLGVLWLQFANLLASNSVHRRCVECSTPFLPSGVERGKKKQFCTDACKSRNYRGKLQQDLRGKESRSH